MIEKRDYTGNVTIEKRADGEDSRMISGYGVVFNQLSREIGGLFKERISPKALDNVDLSEVVAMVNHDSNSIMARANSNTLTLSVDEVGLKYRFEAPNTTAGNDLLENVRNGNYKGSSFQFTGAESEFTFTDDDIAIRNILTIEEVIEVGPVALPAYPSTTAVQRDYQALYDDGILAAKPEITGNLDLYKRKLQVLEL